jgi:hypothetical protein
MILVVTSVGGVFAALRLGVGLETGTDEAGSLDVAEDPLAARSASDTRS